MSAVQNRACPRSYVASACPRSCVASAVHFLTLSSLRVCLRGTRDTLISFFLLIHFTSCSLPPPGYPSYIPSTFLLLFSPEHVRATCVLPPVPPTLAFQVSVRLELPLPLRPHKAAQLEGSPARTYSTYRQQLLGTHPVGVLQDPHENQAAHLLHKCREYKFQPFIFFACWVRH